MRTLKRILVFILFTMALIGVVGGLKYKKVYAVNYSPVFTETFESYAATTSYQGDVNYPKAGFQWDVHYGCVSTTSFITTSKSMHMRWYGSDSTEYPYVILTLDSALAIDKIGFDYAASNKGLRYKVSYSSDGTNYTQVGENVAPPNTDTNNFSCEYDSSISILKLKIEVIAGASTPSAKNYYSLRVDDVKLYTVSSAPQISTPANASISGNVLSFDAVANAVSYNIGYFASEEAEEPLKVVSTTETSYTFKEQSEDGNNFIKIQTIADEVNYLSSNYAYVGTFTNTTITVKTVSEVFAVAAENIAPYTYYDITGTVGEITEPDKSSFKITDGVKEVLVYRLKESKEGNNKSAAELGFAEGDTIRIKAYKETTSGGRLRGYLVSVTPNYTRQFSQLNTFASLKVDYTSSMGVAEENSIATMDIRGTVGNAAVGGSYAYALGLNPSIFKITGLANGGSGNFYIDAANLRFYHDSTNHQGSSMTITGVNGILISKIIFTYVSDTKYQGDLSVIGPSGNVEKVEEGLTRTYELNAPSSYVTIQNTGDKQARIEALTIYYGGSYVSNYAVNTETVEAQEKPLVSLMIGARFSNTLKDNLDGSGTTVTYGIVYAKSTDLETASKTLAEALDAGDSFVHTLEGTPVKVDEDGTANESGDYSQIGVSLNHIPASCYRTDITAAVYVCIDGTYYLMNTSENSVEKVAGKYLNAVSTSYEEHLGILNYLATYVG